MKTLIKEVQNKTMAVIINLIITGVFLLILSILIVWTDLVLRLLVGLIVLLLAYLFFYMAYKIWSVKKEVEKFLKIK